MTCIDLIYFDAGGGHRAAARSLKTVIDTQGRTWDVRLVNLQETLDPIDFCRKLAGVRLQDVYNHLLNRGWTWGTPALCRLMHIAIRALHSRQVPLLEAHWRRSRPDLVVSVVPHFNRALLESLRNVNRQVPFVTVLTDFADYPPHFWIEQQQQFLICGTDRAVEQARSLGHSSDWIFQTSGMIIDPRFYQPVVADRHTERRRLNLDPDRTTGLVLFGGQGSRAMLEIARHLGDSDLPVQLILICGRNEELAQALHSIPRHLPMHIVGFTSEIPYFMQLADFMIGKPGPGSISEALAMNLPVIVLCNEATLPQERYNAEWVLEKGVGLTVPNFHRIEEVTRNFIEPQTLSRYRANVGSVRNRAVFEIPEILDRLLVGKK